MSENFPCEAVIERLRHILGKKYDEFKNLLEETGALISGSFIIQCLLGEHWDSDIDIYIPVSGLLTPSDNPTSKIDEWLLDIGGSMLRYDATCRYGDTMSRGDNIQWIRNFCYPAKEDSKSMRAYDDPKDLEDDVKPHLFQLIHTDLAKEELSDYIVDNFDFSICKNYFRVWEGCENLWMSDYQGIMTSQFKFEFAGNLMSSLVRKVKYEKRGFKIEISKDDVLKSILESQQGERKLHKNRGFVVTTSMNIGDMNNKRYHTFPDNFENYEKINMVDLVAGCKMKAYDQDCDENSECPIKVLGFEHFHTSGSHRGHGGCEDLIILRR